MTSVKYHNACMAVLVIPILCHKTQSLRFLLSPKSRLWHYIFSSNGIVEKEWHMCALVRPAYICALCDCKR